MATEARELGYLDDVFNESEEATGGNCPDGQYEWDVDSMEVRESQTSGNPYLNWTLKVVSPANLAGRVMFHTNNIPTSDSDPDKAKQQLGYLKHDLAVAGVNTKHPQFKLSEFLNNHLNGLLDKRITGNAKTKPDRNGTPRQNTYFDKPAAAAQQVGTGTEGAGGASAGAASAQSEPVSAAGTQAAKPFDPFADE